MRKKIRIMCLALILILNLTMVNAYASSTYDRDAIKSVQSILNMWGYDCGTPDGVQGKNTTEAIKQYQKDQEMTETGEVTQTLIDTMLSGIPLTTLNKRYNEAVDYWNELKDQAGISTLNYSNFTSDETNYCINNNMDIFLGVLPNNNMTGMAWISSDATIDTATALIELYSLVYAFDINVESPVKVQDLVGNILDEVSYDDEGIHFSNKSVKGSGLDIWMKYADLAE